MLAGHLFITAIVYPPKSDHVTNYTDNFTTKIRTLTASHWTDLLTVQSDGGCSAGARKRASHRGELLTLGEDEISMNLIIHH